MDVSSTSSIIINNLVIFVFESEKIVPKKIIQLEMAGKIAMF